MDAYLLLNSKVHGFYTWMPYVTQFTKCTPNLNEAMNNRKTADCVFLDSIKAFDVVPHKLLVEKVSQYSIHRQSNF